jgi:subtilisin family serine protease
VGDLATSAAAGTRKTGPLELVNLPPLMDRTSGLPEIVVGLIDGPVAIDLPHLARENIRTAPGSPGIGCERSGTACNHGTFIAGILGARRSSTAPAICPGCTLLVCPILFEDAGDNRDAMPRATPEELATATLRSIDAGAHVLNLSVALIGRSVAGERILKDALDEAMKRGTLVVAASGNQRHIGGSAITAHPWVIPVTSYALTGRPLEPANLGASIGKRGLGAPGERVLGLTPGGAQVARGGTSVAAPFVTGAIALLWSQFPLASAARIRFAITSSTSPRRRIVPPLLDAWGAYLRMQVGGSKSL